MWRYRARVTVHAPASQIAGRVPAAIEVTPLDENRCQITAGSDTVGMLAAYLGMLEAEFEVHEPPELVDRPAGELERHASSNILIVNPDAPGTLIAADEAVRG